MRDEDDKAFDLWQTLGLILDAAAELASYIVLIVLIVGVLFIMGYVNK